jgi:hypothetical protein
MVHAGQASLTPNGTAHTIASQALSESADPEASQLIHTVYSTGRLPVSDPVPGTEDPAPDENPTIATEPKTNGRAVIAWSRWDGSDYEIAVAFWNGKRWEPIQVLTNNASDDLDVQVVWGRSGLVHLMWRSSSGGEQSFYWAQIDVDENLSQGPDLISMDPVETVSAKGSSDDRSSSAIATDVIFTFDRHEAGGMMSLYGGRDEPMPITSRIDFEPPSGVSSREDPKGFFTGGRLLLTFRTSDRLYYTYRQEDGWIPYRSIHLEEDMTAGKAKALILGMLKRTKSP